MKHWYKKNFQKTDEKIKKESAVLGTDPFGSSELSDKTRTSPLGAAGGEAHVGLFEESDKNHHPNDIFSESGEVLSTEGRLEKEKEDKIKELKLKKEKTKRLKKKYQNVKSKNMRFAQWGTSGPRIPEWKDDWVSKTYKNIKNFEDDSEKNTKEPGIESIVLSTVMIETEFSKEDGTKSIETGSGFFVNKDIIITCKHVVMPDNSIKNKNITITLNGAKYKTYIWSYDEKKDIAAIVVNDSNFPKGNYLKLGNADDCKIGEEIIVIGSPLGIDSLASKGIVSSSNKNINGINIVFISANLLPGNSGGPVVKIENKSVIGMSTAMISENENSNFGLSAAMPIEEIKTFLKNNNIIFNQ